MTASIIVAPISEDRLDDWRAFLDEMTTDRRAQWAESQRRRGVTREVAFLWNGARGSAVVYLMEGVEADAALDALEPAGHDFDRWYRSRLADLHEELDFPARLFDTRPPPGSWRGWRAFGWRRRPNR